MNPHLRGLLIYAKDRKNTHEENTGAGATALNFFLDIRDHSSAMPVQSNENRSITECPLRARPGIIMHSCWPPETHGVMGEMST